MFTDPDEGQTTGLAEETTIASEMSQAQPAIIDILPEEPDKCKGMSDRQDVDTDMLRMFTRMELNSKPPFTSLISVHIYILVTSGISLKSLGNCHGECVEVI